MALELNKILDNPYALKLNSLINNVDLASTAGEMFLVAPENLRTETFIFDTRSDEEITLDSDITDHWVEANYTIQDHIGLKPIQITLSGYVGELTNAPENVLERVVKTAASPIDSLGPFVPQLTTQAQYIMERTAEMYGVYEKANKTVSRFEDVMQKIPVPNVSKQQQAFGKFYEIWKTRQLCTIYTPFGAYNSMAILKLSAKQGEESSYYSDFSITFKQVRIADKITTKETKKGKGRAAKTLSKKADKGVKKPASTAFNLKEKAFSFMRK